mmetsp:Transcript_5540/g.13451  ORF Transcript_5540/g.13451 Transcript_5540/m.13451 type:complete len:586 (+) Transcript_5540:161-1918(+)
MAFTSRSERNTYSRAPGSTPSVVGPGSYGSYFNQEVDHAYAPFSSTADRSAGGAMAQNFVTPGPGTYDLTGKRYHGGPRYLTTPSDVGFLSKGGRAPAVMTEALQKPGPGAYSLPSDFDKRGGLRGRSAPQHANVGPGSPQKNVLWFRAPTAPSIPKQDEAFGYEEGPTGQLVKQQAPFKRYAGGGADAVGPGNYNASFGAVVAYTKGAAFGKSKSLRVSIGGPVSHAAEPTPGPGAYEISAGEQHLQAPSQRRKPSSAFNSRVLRPHQVDHKEDFAAPKLQPGPGAYNIPDSFGKCRATIPETMQCFGSTSKRSTINMHKSLAPGPGAYDNVNFGEGPTGAAGRIQRRAAPFLSTGGRFEDQERKAALLPGPGQYDTGNRNTFVAELAKKRFSRGGNFGSTVERFVFDKDKDKPPAVGGPADYEVKEAKFVHGQVKRGPMSVFLSDTSRFKKAAMLKDGPAPGQYYKSVEWGTGYKRPDNAPGQRAFISQTKRFDMPGMKKEIPGPGQYSSDVNTVGGEVNKLLKRRMLSGDETAPGMFGGSQRFIGPGNGLKAGVPGPGSYNAVDPYAQLIKRSFNITVEGSI